MQRSQAPLILTTPTSNPPIQGDAATRRFGMFFFIALAVVTIGAGVGIGVGNIAHYRYFPPNNRTNITSEELYNLTASSAPVQTGNASSLSVDRTIEKRDLVRLWASVVAANVTDRNDQH